MQLFVGLGNPGPQYAMNRHNIGFMALDVVAATYGFGPWKAKLQGAVTEGSVNGCKVLLLKPMTFMNLSGRSVAEAMRFYKLPLEALTVFHDELDLAAGKVRIKMGGGTAGHNGLRSIDEHLGPNFRRIRLGIGHPGDKSRVTSHVLGNFTKEDHEWLEPLLGFVAAEAGWIAKQDEVRFATEVARRMQAIETKTATSASSVQSQQEK